MNLIQLTPDMTVGTVPVSSLTRRRENYRKMTPTDRAALNASVGKFGFKTFVTVVAGDEPGTFEIIDGHHRWEIAQERGIETIPIVLLDKSFDRKELDLAMLSFNVSAEIIPEVYVDYLRDVQEAFGAETASLFTGVDQDFLANLSQSCDDAIASLNVDAGDADGDAQAPTGPGSDTSVRVSPKAAAILTTKFGAPTVRAALGILIQAAVTSRLVVLPVGSESLIERASKATGRSDGAAVAALLSEVLEDET